MSNHLGSKSLIIVDSVNRLDGTSSNFTSELKLPRNNKYDSVVVLQASIPKSWYVIPENYNTFTLEESSNQTTITIPPGNYSRTSLQSVLKTLLDTGSSTLGYNYVYTVTYPSISTASDTGKFTFTLTGNGVIQPKLIFGSSTFVANAMGFETNTTYSFTDSTLTSPRMINLQSHNSVILRSDLVNEYSSGNVLQEILAGSTPYLSNVSYQATGMEANRKHVDFSKNNKYHFTLTDTSGEILDLNGLNFSFSLLFFRKNDLFSLSRSYLGLQMLKENGQGIA